MGKQETELIFVPFPITGHLLVTIELAKRLISHDPSRIHTITILHWSLPFIPRSETDAFVQSLANTGSRIRLVTLPDVQDPPPMELFVKASEAYILEFVKKIVPFARDALSTLLSSRDKSDSVRVAGLVLDLFCSPLMDVGKEFNLPSYIFLTCSAGFLGLMKYLPERHRRIASKFDRSSGDELNPVPGFVKPVPTRVLPPGLFTRESYEATVEIAERFPEAKGILVNSFTSLEPNAFEYFSHRPDNYPPVYPIGPILCSKDRPCPKPDPVERDRIIKWLDDKPKSSVLFLCFGSMKNLSEPQIKEVAQALERVGCKFLWSIRTDPTAKKNLSKILPDGFENRVMNRGLVCGWAPQVEVLSHKSIGGFVSHCGWNSTLESMWFGVPIVTWPMYAEQQLNAFTMVKELELALGMRLDFVWADGEIVTADEIAGAVRSLMDGDDVPRKKLNAIADAAKQAVKDGSSFLAVDRFIDQLTDDGL